MSIRYYIYLNQIKRLDGLALDKQDTNSHTQRATVLARRIMAGDGAAEDEFVRLIQGWLLFVIRRQFARSGHHEDILQDAFLLVLNKLKDGEVKKPESIMSFVRTTAINIGYEYLKKDKKFASAVEQPRIDFIEDAHSGILSQVIWEDKMNYVQQVIQELRTQRDKDILMDFYFNHVSKKNICQELALTSEHFDRVIYRAKQRLKDLINEADNNNDHGNDSKTNTRKTADKNIKNLFQSMVLTLFKWQRGVA